MIALLEKLLVNSYSGNYDSIIAVIHDELTQHTNATIHIQSIAPHKANVIAYWGTPRFVINAHMDTVPPTGDWDKDPHQLTSKNDSLYGLGCCDVKGSIAALLDAVKDVTPQDTMLLFSVDEESGGVESGVTYFLKSEYAKTLQSALVCEPTGCALKNAHPGYYSFELQCKTEPQHSSLITSETKNSIVDMATYLPVLHQNGFNIAKIHGGDRGNVVPDYCESLISIRTYEFHQDVKQRILQTGIPLEFVSAKTLLPPLINPNPPCQEVLFWTEAALFAQAGISAEVFGPGNIAQAHTVNEFITQSQLKKAKKWFEKRFLTQF